MGFDSGSNFIWVLTRYNSERKSGKFLKKLQRLYHSCSRNKYLFHKRDSGFNNSVIFIQAFRVVLGRAYRRLTGGSLLLRIFSVAISVSPRVCFILVLIIISMFLR